QTRIVCPFGSVTSFAPASCKLLTAQSSSIPWYQRTPTNPQTNATIVIAIKSVRRRNRRNRVQRPRGDGNKFSVMAELRKSCGTWVDFALAAPRHVASRIRRSRENGSRALAKGFVPAENPYLYD